MTELEAAFRATSDPALMRRVRTQLMLGPRTEAERRQAAMFDDRVRALEGKLQWYGTEYGWDARGEWTPLQCAQPEQLALRRRAMGLGPMVSVLPSEPRPADVAAWQRDRDAFAVKHGWRDDPPALPPPTLILAESGDPVYRDAVELRYRVLRAPLGVARADFKPDDPGERVTVCALYDGAVVGTVALELEGKERGRLRQMAVAPEHQGGRVGRALVSALEREAKRRGLSTIWMNARAHVIGFYARAGYACSSEDLFDEVHIPHVHMEKRL
jgi:GNAT superfamily N-acetyltransferase